jgi:hypothetical protein
MTDGIVIRRKIQSLRPEEAVFVDYAHRSTGGRFPISKPGVFSIIFNIGVSLLASAGGAIITLLPLLTGKSLMTVTTVAGLLIIGTMGPAFMYSGIRLIVRRIHRGYFYILVHPDCFIERLNSKVTLIPKRAIIGAYDSTGRTVHGPCVQYRKEDGTAGYYHALNEYPFGRRLPSPVIKKIREVYGVGDPASDDEY